MDHDTTRRRALAIAGVTALMLVALVSLMMIAQAVSGGREEETPVAAATPAPARTPKPRRTPRPRPTPVPLTAEQRAARAAAAQIVRSRGFEVVRLRDYDPRRTLRVLLGRDSAGSRLAFFFVGDRYIGNDAAEPSAELRVKRQGDAQVTLTYRIFPSRERIDVRFRWDGVRLEPVDALPPIEQRRRPPPVSPTATATAQ